MKRILKISLIALIVGVVLILTGDFLSEEIQVFFQSKTEINRERPNNGYYKEYYESGRLKSEEFYENGKKEGTWKTYFPNGSIQTIKTFNENLLQGLTAHYDSCEVLVFTELFEDGVCKKREIVNDSLYKFKIRIMPHGKLVFEKNCSQCHDVKQSLLVTADSIKQPILTFISMDSIHMPIFHKPFLDSLERTKLYRDTIPLNDYDVKSLQFFLENISTKPSHQPKYPKKLRVKGRTS